MRPSVKSMAIGGVILLVGITISLVTYLNASDNAGGGSYFVAFGPMIFGAITLVRGAFDFAKGR